MDENELGMGVGYKEDVRPTSKQWKRVPFDIELAKKIQSGEVEGRIVTAQDCYEMEILTFDSFDKEYPIIARYKDMVGEGLTEYHIDGKTNPNGIEFIFDLVIELPEETPKHEFKVGDKVKYHGFEDEPEIYRIVKIKDSRALLNDGTDVSFDEIILYEEKHEFKPFDKVLVRDIKREHPHWTPAIFQEKDNSPAPYMASGLWWRECIPYEGNEHLVGTTNNPE